MTPADVLELAADALFVHGRAFGAFKRPDGSMCVLGAIAFVLGDGLDGVEIPAAALGLFLGEPAWLWNDRTEDDALVIDTLKQCAKSLREVES